MAPNGGGETGGGDTAMGANVGGETGGGGTAMRHMETRPGPAGRERRQLGVGPAGADRLFTSLSLFTQAGL